MTSTTFIVVLVALVSFVAGGATLLIIAASGGGFRCSRCRQALPGPVDRECVLTETTSEGTTTQVEADLSGKGGGQ